MAPARGAAAQPRQAAVQAAAAHRGVGARVRRCDGESAAVHGPAASQARAGPATAAPAAHRARRALPLPAGPRRGAAGHSLRSTRDLHRPAAGLTMRSMRVPGAWRLAGLSPRRRIFVMSSSLVAAVAVVLGGLQGAGAFSRPAPTAGSGAFGTVLLVPGYGGSTAALDVLADRIRATGRTTQIVRLPGNGTGDLAAQAAVLNGYVNRALRAGTGLVDVIGYSAGGVERGRPGGLPGRLPAARAGQLAADPAREDTADPAARLAVAVDRGRPGGSAARVGAADRRGQRAAADRVPQRADRPWPAAVRAAGDRDRAARARCRAADRAWPVGMRGAAGARSCLVARPGPVIPVLIPGPDPRS